MGEDDELEKLRKELAEQKKVMDTWKEKVKAITIKDRQKIAAQQEEIDQLGKQLKTITAIAKEKEENISKLEQEKTTLEYELKDASAAAKRAAELQRKVDELSSTVGEQEDVIETLRSAQKQVQAKIAEAERHGREEFEEVANAKSQEVQKLRARILELEKQCEQHRTALDGSAFLNQRGELTVVKRVRHNDVYWCLCSKHTFSGETLPCRWFEQEKVLAVAGNISMPPTEAEETRQQLMEEFDARNDCITSTAKGLQAENERVIRQKDQEISDLLKRIEDLQCEHAKTITRLQHSEEAKIAAIQAESSALSEQQFEEKFSEIRAERDGLTAELESLRREHASLQKEYTSYKKRAQQALTSQPVNAVLQREVEELKEKLEAKAKEVARVEEEKEKLKQELEEMKAEEARVIAGGDSEVAARDACIKQLQKQLSDLHRQRDEQEQEGAGLSEVAAGLREKAREAESQREKAEEEKAKLETVVDELRKENSALCSERQRLEEVLTMKNSALAALTEEVCSLRGQTEHAAHPNSSNSSSNSSSSSSSSSTSNSSAPRANGARTPLHVEGETSLPNDSPKTFGPNRHSMSCDTMGGTSEVDCGFDFEDLMAVAELSGRSCSRSPATPGDTDDMSQDRMQLELYARKVHRVTSELAASRKDLEGVRQDLSEALESEKRLRQQEKLLKENIRELERKVSRVHNAEEHDYLKNVLVQFCLAKGADHVQAELIPVLSSLLQLSPAERACLERKYHS